MNWINYIFRIPVAAICTGFVALLLFIILAMYAIFINWEKGSAEFKDIIGPDMYDFFDTIAGLK